jgi:predicted PurR-regulated permease PerM
VNRKTLDTKNSYQPAAFSDLLEKIPFYERLLPYKETILQKAGELVGRLSSFLINSLSSVTVMTAQLIFMLFIFLYTMFFFLVDGDRILYRMLYYLPLKPEDEERMLDRFTSVTRATLKGVAVIGILQGVLTGCAFAVIGIPSSIFWGTITAVMSLVPGIGTAIVWLPASIILASGGHYGQAIGCLSLQSGGGWLGQFPAAAAGRPGHPHARVVDSFRNAEEFSCSARWGSSSGRSCRRSWLPYGRFTRWPSGIAARARAAWR